MKIAATGKVLLLLGLALSLPSPAVAQTRVSLELLLAVDTSLSVDDREYELQMRGIADAFRSPEVIELIGKHQGGVAVGIMQWSGIADQESVRWRLLSDARSALAYAEEIGKLERWPYGYLTGVGEAILSGIEQLDQNGFGGRERKIDVSGDGRSNTGPAAADARDAALLQGITINGLAILNAELGLGEYYETEVIGGKGAFLIETADYRAFAEAMLRKLIRELELNVSEAPHPSRFARAPALYSGHD